MKFAITIVVTLLLTTTLFAAFETTGSASVHAELPSNVTFDLLHYYPDGYVHGVPQGQYVGVDVYVDASALTPELGMFGWGLYVTVDPAVLTPYDYTYGAAPGYFLYDWCVIHSPGSQPYLVWYAGADYIECSEFIMPKPPTGATGVGKLCTLYFTSNSQYAYSPITIVVYKDGELMSGYQNVTGSRHPIVAINGHYNQPLNYHTLTVESTPIDGIDFTILTTTYTTNLSVSLPEGLYNVSMPSTWTVGNDAYSFQHWEDGSTNAVRIISLTTDQTIVATYEFVEALPPVAVIEAPTEEYVNNAVTFDGSQSYDPDGGSIVSYQWNFGDGNVTTTTNPTIVHTYTSIGTYGVNLVVTDDEAQVSDPATHILGIKGYLPVAVIVAPSEGYVNEAITFSGADSYDPDGGVIVNYQWNFGDGDVISTDNSTIVHTYTMNGTYEVTLVVIDDENQESDPATHEMRVHIKSPIDGIQELIETIESWNLPIGTELSLTSKLEEAVHLLNMENEVGAIHKLMDLIDQVEALRSKGKLEDWQADHLVTEVQTIISII